MQFAVTLAALAATASASFAVRDEVVKNNFGISKVVNRCPYDVYLWSIDKQLGCNSDGSTLLKKNGGQWQEQMHEGTNGGISVKISKFDNCGGKELTQLEYKIETKKGEYNGNYLDMSFVDCQKGGDCPGWHDGFYMESGFKAGTKVYASEVNNERCPILKASNAQEAAKISYVLPDDRQTKFCKSDADLTLYICGDQAPGASDNTPSAAPSSSKPAPSSSQAKPSTFQILPSKPAAAPSKSADDVKVKAAEVTAAPKAPAPEAPKNVKTVITHAHGRRHNHRA
ncbi:hypothetical protein DM02DRAFT_644692 [Periconia macrospinosa]|uniref:Lytic polysaccharide monooxygenase n=1 Tax=Periconia macrospinosa TaxID=97972 RepID=A0A2V1DHF1_9PLEO|nr:hypothetical protein DM02DRAFT_644692 [Periconia macrospinosa]